MLVNKKYLCHQIVEMALLMIIFLVTLGLQLLYILIYIVSIGRYKSVNNNTADSTSVSVVVCAFNELENLKKLIPKLLNQNHKTFEVIIVNDQSTDGTYDYLMEMKGKHPNVKIVQIDHTPDHFSRKKYGITLGVKAASYDTMVFTDADCYPSTEDWLKSIASQYHGGTKIILGASMYEKGKDFLNYFIQYETYWTAIQYVGCALIGTPYMGVGRNLSYQKSLFLDSKGFNGHQHVMGGDDDLFVNAHASSKNTKVAIGKDMLTYSYPKTTWSCFFKQKMRHLSVGKYYKFKHQIILGIYTLSYLLFWSVGIGLIFGHPEIIGAAILVRIGLMYVMYYTASKKMGEVFVPLILPVLDIVFGFYYIATTGAAVFSKRIKWR